jgi:hypothetical protein
MDTLEDRVADLEAQLEALAIRHSALEWFVEQHVCAFLMQQPRGEAEAWIDQVSHVNRPAWRLDGAASLPVIPDHQAALAESIAHVGAKIRTRLREGRREG